MKKSKHHISEPLSIEEYKTFFETLGKYVIASATDSAGNIIYANDKFVEISKYTREELLGQNHRILKSEHHDPGFYHDLWKTISSGKVWRGEIKNRAKDGTFYWVDTSIAPVIGKDGKPEKYVSVRFLITERKRVEEELKRRKEHSEFLVGATAVLASSLDYETVLRHIAELLVPRMADWCAIDLIDFRTAEQSLRRVAVTHVDPSKIALSQQLQSQYPPKQESSNGATRVFKSGRSEFYPEIPSEYMSAVSIDVEHKYLMEELGLRSLLRVPLQHRGKVLGVITLAYGRSGRRYSTDDLELAEELGRRSGVAIENARLYQQVQDADRRKDEFIATLAHELRNPLAPLLIRSQHLREYAGHTSDPLIKESAIVMERQVKVMARLLDDLLDISRLMRGKIILKKEHIDLSKIIARAVETTRSLFDASGVKLVVETLDEPLVVYVDPIRLEQVIVNIINNAAKFSSRGDNVWLTMKKDAENVYISVKDEGSGIKPEYLPIIFDIFIQADRPKEQAQGGLGIGLALAKNFVQLHGGTINVHSDGPDRGSEFIVCLPLSGINDHTVAQTGVLVVDDNTDAADALAQYLTFKGYKNVGVASSGNQAINMGKALRPSFVLLDIRMPGMDGYATIEAMQREPEFREAKFIAITGYGQEEDKLRAEEAGFDYHFTKPVDSNMLMEVLEKEK